MDAVYIYISLPDREYYFFDHSDILKGSRIPASFHKIYIGRNQVQTQNGGRMVVRGFLNDEKAVEGLPMRIAVTAIIFSVILGLTGKAAFDFIGDIKEKKLMGELDMIEKRAAVMYVQGGARDIDDPGDHSGTAESINVKIPDITAFVVFGGMPDGSANERTDNVYYYVLNNGRVQAKSSTARFSGGTVLYPGEYELKLELVRSRNGTFVEIRGI